MLPFFWAGFTEISPNFGKISAKLSPSLQKFGVTLQKVYRNLASLYRKFTDNLQDVGCMLTVGSSATEHAEKEDTTWLHLRKQPFEPKTKKLPNRFYDSRNKFSNFPNSFEIIAQIRFCKCQIYFRACEKNENHGPKTSKRKPNAALKGARFA